MCVGISFHTFAADIYIYNFGTSNNSLEDALNIIKTSYVDANNNATEAINIYLVNNWGDVQITDSGNTLNWDVSGTSQYPITITSYSCRTTLTRNLDSGPMLYMEQANYVNIINVDFNAVSSGAILIDNCDHLNISYCSFHGNGTAVPAPDSGIIWIGVNHNYAGQNTETSAYNKITNNYFHSLDYLTESFHHHGIYFSNGAHHNTFAYNYIDRPASFGIHGYHGDFQDNYLSTNLIIRRPRVNNQNATGVIFGSQNDLITPGVTYDNGAPGSIHGNNAVNNYIFDDENNHDGVDIETVLAGNNYESGNKRFDNLYPNDPYWLGYNASKITARMVSGDFDRDGVEDDVAAFYDLSGQTKIHVWESLGADNAFEYSSSNGWWHGSSYTASNVSKRVVSGDFDRDGKKDDIAAFYDYGSGHTRIHVWTSNGSSFNTPQTWWIVSGYTAGQISGRLVSGDFDRDGYEDDIAAFYDYGGGQTRIHVWTTNTNFWGTGISFNYQNSTGWWSTFGYTAGQITDRVVSGDFDRDGYKDDIAAFYDNGGGNTSIHTWRSTGSSFTYSNSFGWWNTSGYDANKITGRVVSGDFDRDGYKDDIAAFYKTGTHSTQLHTWRSTGGSFSYSGSPGWWSSNGYTPDNITGRVIAGDFDKDGKLDDISAFYDHSSNCGNVRSNVWQGTGSNFTYINSSMGYPWMTGYTFLRNQAYVDEPMEETVLSELKVLVYPNPATDRLTIELNEKALVQFSDLNGKIVYSNYLNQGSSSIDISNFSAGIYVYSVLSDGQTSRGKVVVK